jgi:hypothetical protein
MEELRKYQTLARACSSKAEFVEQCDHLFLVKRPVRRASASTMPSAISFETKLTRLDVDPFATEWRVAPVRKREGSPYPDRFSIGRAPNCDVVIRMPSVSKVHAYILITGPSSYALRDNEASNFTYVNGRRVEAKGTVPLRLGDEVILGALKLEFVDAEQLYGIAKAES